jgi:hypothetical protein
VLGINYWWSAAKKLLAALLVVVLGWGLVSCGDRSSPVITRPPGEPGALVGRLSEVAPPTTIRQLRQALEAYQPQVKILSPRPDEVLQDTEVAVRLRVQDLPVFRDEALELGPHLQVVLDNQPVKDVYDVSEPLTLKDLAPGTHTLRVFAARPWHESFKNEGAFAQTTFHIFTKTPENNPDPTQPLLTYGYPEGSTGAEPILLDFYLTNAPLHLVAQEDAEDEIADWKIRCTINGESFIFDRWQPIYLKGLNPGKNWVQLELLNETGKPLPNAFNNTVRLITYEPGGKDPLAQLIRGELSAAAARGIVDPNYVPVPEPVLTEPQVEQSPAEVTSEPPPEIPIPEVLPQVAPAEPVVEPEAPSAAESIEKQPAPESETSDQEEPVIPEAKPAVPPIEPTKSPASTPSSKELAEPAAPEIPAAPTPVPPPPSTEPLSPIPSIPDQDKQSVDRPKGYFNRRKALEAVENPPATKAPIEAPAEPLAPSPLPTSEGDQAIDSSPSSPEPDQPEAFGLPVLFDRVKGFFEGLRQPASLAPAVSPVPSPVVVPPVEPVQPEPLVEPPMEPPAIKSPAPKAASQPDAGPKAVLERPRSLEPELPDPPTLPEVIEAPTVEEALPEEQPQEAAPSIPAQPDSAQPDSVEPRDILPRVI